MSKAHIELWTNTALYEEKKQAAQPMLEKFDGKEVAKQYLALYYELLNITSLLYNVSNIYSTG
jgi:hypothetical protein